MFCDQAVHIGSRARKAGGSSLNLLEAAALFYRGNAEPSVALRFFSRDLQHEQKFRKFVDEAYATIHCFLIMIPFC